jgi:RNA polymerase sigma factor (sigma-70 family)
MEHPTLSAAVLERIRREVRRLAPAGEVDDLAQEACVRVIEKEGLWRAERGGFAPWAGAVARNLTRGALARAGRERAARAERAALLSAEGQRDELSEERIAFVLEQFARLPEEARQVLAWRYLDGRTVTDIARELGVSQPAVSQRIARALAELRRRARGRGLAGLGIGPWIGANKMKITLVGAAAATAVVGSTFYLQDDTARVVGTTLATPSSGFAATLDTALAPHRNLLFCASAPLAWAELRELAGGPVRLDTQPAVVDALNASAFPAQAIDERSWVAGAGFTDDGTVERLQDELVREFGEGRDPVLDALVAEAGPGQVLSYAFLYKQLAWRVEFEELAEPLPFRWRDPGADPVERETPVSAFGIAEFDGASREWHKRLGRQVHVWEENGAFAVQLSSEGLSDRVLLAAVEPAETLAATVDRALALASGTGKRLRQDDSLRVPVVDLDLFHDWSEIHGMFENESLAGRNLSIALQTIRFRLDHRGALLKSRFAVAGAESEHAPEPRRLHFDRPFLILMRENEKAPYFAMWVAHPELLATVEESR